MSATETRHIGAALKRKEDDPLLRGRGSFVDNVNLAGTVVMSGVTPVWGSRSISISLSLSA